MNTHNYVDFLDKESRERMTRISTLQKELTGKYRCAMYATVEYRKNMPLDSSKMKFPVDDDIADARALLYRPNVIAHVYNDLHDRQENAEVVWFDGGVIRPRLLIGISKNKLTDFKDKLTLDLDPKTVTLTQKDTQEARAEVEAKDASSD